MSAFDRRIGTRHWGLEEYAIESKSKIIVVL